MAPALLPPIQSLLLQEPDVPHDARPDTSASSSQSLLTLDCSADLKSYSRNLGPSARDRSLGKRGDLSPSPLQELPQQQIPVVRCRPSIPSLTQIDSVAHSSVLTPTTLTPTRTVTLNLYSPTPRPPPPQFLTQSPLIENISLAMAPEVQEDDISTYPVGLRVALDECTTTASREAESGDAMYHVIHENRDQYIGNTFEIQGIYKALRTANLEAAKYYVTELLDAVESYGAEPKFEVMEGGMLRCEGEVEDAYAVVYVKRMTLK